MLAPSVNIYVYVMYLDKHYLKYTTISDYILVDLMTFTNMSRTVSYLIQFHATCPTNYLIL